jgi:hypothetical protein
MELFCDSFDHYATATQGTKWSTVSGTTIGAVGQNGTQGMQASSGNGGTAFAIYSYATNTNTMYVGIAINKVAWGTNTNQLLSFVDGGSLQISLVVLAGDNNVYVYRGGTTALLATASVPLIFSTYYYVEFAYLPHPSTGSFELRFNGTLVAADSGINTAGSGNARTTGLLLGHSLTINGTKTVQYDDLYLIDSSGTRNNTFLGPRRVVCRLPDAVGNSSDFTPSGGAVDNYTMVDETLTDGDTTYNTATTPGDHDTYGYQAVGVPGAIAFLQTNLMQRSAGSGAETTRPKIRIGSTDYNGTTGSVATSYLDRTEVFGVSPATGVAWTTSEVDGAEFGMELVS